MAVQWPDDSMFNHFTVFEETYKTVESHDIKAAVLIPKSITQGPHPIILNFHGGFLMYGHALFAPFFAPWVLKLALEASAVVVSGDYRLLPSANDVADSVEDLEDFWQWTRSHFPAILQRRAPSLSPDFTRLLLTGGSAGGYCAAQLGLSHPDEISAIAMTYPFVEPEDEVMVNGVKDGETSVLRFPVESLPPKEDVVQWLNESKKMVKTRAGMETTPYAVAAAQYGLFYSHVFDSSNLRRPEFSPTERLRAGARLPKNIWILTGDDDSIVYLRTIQKFVDMARQKLPNSTIRLDIARGEDHAFDLTKTTWEMHAIGGMEFVRKSWLGK